MLTECMWFLLAILLENFAWYSFSWMPPLSSEFIDSCARELGGKRLLIDFPWEKTQFETLLSKKQRTVIKPPDWIEFPSSASSQTDAPSRPTRLCRYNARRHMSDVSWVASEDRRLNLALQCWKVIVLDSTSNTDLGAILMRCIELGKSEDYIWQVVHDAFSSKATATLRARASSLLAFGRWKRSMCVGSSEGIFPISEEMAYEYLCELRANKAAPSKGRRFVESLGFAKGLIGAKVNAVLESSRVRGAADGSGSRPVKKESPLTVDQLLILERITIFGQGQDAIFAGYICFLTHCRLRWSDGQHCIQEPSLDINPETGVGFLEAALYHHKTARKKRSNVMRLLPVASVIPGLSGLNWAEHWLYKRSQMNMRGSMRQPMMPAPITGDKWTCQPLTSSEANPWLRELLGPWTQAPITEISTHSAKATLLSWLAKSNVDINLRRLAGYHVKPGDKSALEYSRDAAAPVLRQIEAVFISIRAEFFRPDRPRSSRWSGAHSLEEAVRLAAEASYSVDHQDFLRKHFSGSLLSLDVEPVNCHRNEPDSKVDDAVGTGFEDDMTLEDLRIHTMHQPQFNLSSEFVDVASDISDWTESVESSTDDDSDSDDVERQAVLNGEKNATDLVAPSDLAGKSCYRHFKSQKLHLVGRHAEGAIFFRCGRKCNENYLKLSVVPAFTAHGCMMCFGWSDHCDEAASDPD
eukprot:s4577_g1.t1